MYAKVLFQKYIFESKSVNCSLLVKVDVCSIFVQWLMQVHIHIYIYKNLCFIFNYYYIFFFVHPTNEFAALAVMRRLGTKKLISMNDKLLYSLQITALLQLFTPKQDLRRCHYTF